MFLLLFFLIENFSIDLVSLRLMIASKRRITYFALNPPQREAVNK